MALIKCPNCGKQYSEHAEKCPKCGLTLQDAQKASDDRAIAKRAKQKLFLKGFALISLAIIIIASIYIPLHKKAITIAGVAKLDSGEYVYINHKGKALKPLEYNRIIEDNSGLLKVMDDSGDWGYIDFSGTVIVPLRYSKLDYYNNLKVIRAENSNGVSILDTSNNTITRGSYVGISPVKQNNLIVVINGSHSGVLNKDWMPVKEFKYNAYNLSDDVGKEEWMFYNDDELFFVANDSFVSRSFFNNRFVPATKASPSDFIGTWGNTNKLIVGAPWKIYIYNYSCELYLYSSTGGSDVLYFKDYKVQNNKLTFGEYNLILGDNKKELKIRGQRLVKDSVY